MKLILFFLLAINFLLNAQPNPYDFHVIGEGNSLSKINYSTPTSNSISDIIAVGDTVWLGTSRGVSVSFDRGANWINFYARRPFGEDNVSAIGYNQGVVWVATATSVDAPGGGTVPKGTGLKFTTDNGSTWSSIPQPVDDQSATTEIYGINILSALPVTVAEQNLTYDIAFTPGTVWITSWASGLRKSTDNGTTWHRVVLPPDYLDSISPDDTLDFCISPSRGKFCDETNYNHVAFSVIAIDDTTLYVGTADGINKSTDNGISWVKYNHLNQDEPISGNFITALAYNNVTNTVWAATWKANDQSEYFAVSSSDNGGVSWKTFLRDEKTHNFGFKDFDVFAVSDNGAFRSSNEGNSWITPSAIVDTISDPTSNLYLRTNMFYSAAAEGNAIWLGTNDGLAKLLETSFWKGAWKLYFASQTLKSASETYAYPNPFSPMQEQLKIKYTTGGKESSVTIRIYDFGMNYVRTVIQNAPRNRDNDGPPDFWDGRDDAGNIVPNGVYLYRVDIDSNNPLFGKIIVMR